MVPLLAELLDLVSQPGDFLRWALPARGLARRAYGQHRGTIRCVKARACLGRIARFQAPLRKR
jgi:hypothetical protein